MKKILFIISAVILIIIKVFSQSGSLQLTFTAVNNEDYVKLDSIKIINKSLYCDTVLHYPDTVIILDYEVGILESEKENPSLKVFQNYPNPVNEMTTISLSVPEKDLVSMIIQDVFGQVIIKTESILEKGYHSFQFVPGSSNLYFFTARWRSRTETIKIISSISGSNMNASLEYVGIDKSTAHLKGAPAVQSFPFNLGDDLLFIGFANTLQSGILDSPEISQNFIPFSLLLIFLVPGHQPLLTVDRYIIPFRFSSEC